MGALLGVVNRSIDSEFEKLLPESRLRVWPDTLWSLAQTQPQPSKSPGLPDAAGSLRLRSKSDARCRPLTALKGHMPPGGGSIGDSGDFDLCLSQPHTKTFRRSAVTAQSQGPNTPVLADGRDAWAGMPSRRSHTSSGKLSLDKQTQQGQGHKELPRSTVAHTQHRLLRRRSGPAPRLLDTQLSDPSLAFVNAGPAKHSPSTHVAEDSPRLVTSSPHMVKRLASQVPAISVAIPSAELSEEAVAACRAKQDWLTVADLQQFDLPAECNLDLTDICLLYVIDTDHTGRITPKKVQDFALMVSKLGYYTKAKAEANSLVYAFCTLELWDCARFPAGQDQLVTWLLTLFCEVEPPVMLAIDPHVLCFSNTTVEIIYSVLRVQGYHNILFPEFLELLQELSVQHVTKRVLALGSADQGEQVEWSQKGPPRQRFHSQSKRTHSHGLHGVKLPQLSEAMQTRIARLVEAAIPVDIIHQFFSQYIFEFVQFTELLLFEPDLGAGPAAE